MRAYVLIMVICYCCTAMQSVQACCKEITYGGQGDGELYMLQPDGGMLPSEPDELSYLVFGRAGLPLSVPSCIADSGLYHVVDKLGSYKYIPITNYGTCNFAGCNCDHCFGLSNCEGTDDHPGSPIYGERFTVKWFYSNENWFYQYQFYENRPCLDAEGRPQLEPYLRCPPRASLAQAAAAADPAAAGAMTAAETAAACADRDRVLAEPLEATEARLSMTFCAAPRPGGARPSVGRAFAAAALAALDANNDGSVSCAEWGIAKMRPTLEQLGGAYHGPRSLPLPECPMSAEGAEAFARHNAYLAGLAVATAARADNATAGADTPQGR